MARLPEGCAFFVGCRSQVDKSKSNLNSRVLRTMQPLTCNLKPLGRGSSRVDAGEQAVEDRDDDQCKERRDDEAADNSPAHRRP